MTNLLIASLKTSGDPSKEEIWTTVRNYSGYYVSSAGRCGSCRGWGPKKSFTPYIRLLKGSRKTSGKVIKRTYISIHLSTGNGYRNAVNKGLHVLVLEAFVGPCPAGMEGCHNNGHADDNRLTNLRWDTPKNNQADKLVHGTSNVGDNHGFCSIKDSNIPEVLKLISEYETDNDISKMFNVSRQVITDIRLGKTRSNITGIVNIRKTSETRKSHSSKLKPPMLHDIVQRIQEGQSDEAIAVVYQVHKYTINSIRLGKRHSKITGINPVIRFPTQSSVVNVTNRRKIIK